MASIDELTSRSPAPSSAPNFAPSALELSDGPIRRVACELAMSVTEPVRLSLQIAPSDSVPFLEEVLEVTSDGKAISAHEVWVPGNGRVHVCTPPPGLVEITYRAALTGRASVPAVTEEDRIVYLRPSRYAESDRLAPMAQTEFAGIADPGELLTAVSSWVGTHLTYVAGSSGPTDGSVDTMLKRQGVCRDYAHLVIALLRAMDVPARLAAVYAPGLDPMDFHAVAEAAVGDTWQVVDATLLAPRSSFVRICTGRDAGDTAFISTNGGQAEFLNSVVYATIDGALPTDDLGQSVCLT